MVRKFKPLGKRVVAHLRRLARRRQQLLTHRLHHEHHISRKTLFYMKEYGKGTHVTRVIVRESFKVLIAASIISSIGGIGLQGVQERIIGFLPFLILLPALNDMVGDFGTIVSSKFTTLLYLKKVEKRWWLDEDVHELMLRVFAIAIVAAVYVVLLSFGLAALRGYAVTLSSLVTGIAVGIAATLTLVTIIAAAAIIGGMAIYKRGEDPNNFLIPITTALGDLGSLLLLSWIVSVIA